MKKVWVSLVSLAILASTNPVRAGETAKQISVDKATKTASIQALQATIASHQGMTEAQIRADIKERAGKNLEQVAKVVGPKLDVAATLQRTVDLISAFDKDALIAQEQLLLQKLQSSSNSIMWLTRMDLEFARDGGRDDATDNYAAAAMFPFAVIIDIAMLPFTFIVSAVTGF